MTKRPSGWLAAVLLCVFVQVSECAAADPPAKTGEKRDTMIYVRSVPPGAKVSVGGEELGRTPGLFTVKATVATVVLELEGYGQVKEQVRIRADGITRIVIELKPQAAPGETMAAHAGTAQPVKRLHLPDADDANQDKAVVLDLASGQLLSVPHDADGHLKWPSASTELGKGDLFYDQVIGCLRGGRIKKWDGKQFVDLSPSRRMDTITQYELPSLPCRLLVTTAEGRQFDVTILAAANQVGAELEFREYRPASGQITSETPSNKQNERGISLEESVLRDLYAKFIAAAIDGRDFPLQNVGPGLPVPASLRDLRKTMAAGAQIDSIRLVRIRPSVALIVTNFFDIAVPESGPKRTGCLIATFVKKDNNWALNDIDFRTEKQLAERLKRFDAGQDDPQSFQSIARTDTIGQLQNALEHKPGDAGLHVRLADALAKQGRRDEAIVHYRKALANDPNNAGAKTGLRDALAKPVDAPAAETPQPVKRVHLPDADDAKQGKAVILDLATGEMLKVPRDAEGRLKQPSTFGELGKGDLFYDRLFGCLRGGTAKIWQEGQFVDFPRASIKKKGDVTGFQPPQLPCRLLVTTAEKRQFEVTVLSAANDAGAELEYREYRPSEAQRAAVAPPNPRDAEIQKLSDESTPEQALARADESALRELVVKLVAATTKSEGFPHKNIGPQLRIHDIIGDMRRAMAAGANLGDVSLIRIVGNSALVATKFADINDHKYKAKNPFCVSYSWRKQNGDWMLTDIDLEDKKGLAKEIERLAANAAAKSVDASANTNTAAGSETPSEPVKRVTLPNSDDANRDKEVILDLATGRMLKIPKDTNGRLEMPHVFTKLGKGDLFFDREFGCLRGGSVKKWNGSQLVVLPPKKKGRDAVTYELPPLPCRLLVITAEKQPFDLTVISKTGQGGIVLEYKLADRQSIPTTDARSLGIAQPAITANVVSTNPPNGALDVDPTIKELRITFDVPMPRAFSWTSSLRNSPKTKTTGSCRWTEDRKTCILPVELKPDWDYEFYPTGPTFGHFPGPSGLLRFKYRFTTRGDAKPSDIPQPVKVHLPAANDPNDERCILDLAKGQTHAPPRETNGGPFNPATAAAEGDLCFLRDVYCLRGARARLWDENDKRFVDLRSKKYVASNRTTIYELPSVPCRLLITTVDKKPFDVSVLSVSDAGAVDLEYRPADPRIVRRSNIPPGRQDDIFLPNAHRSAKHAAVILDLATGQMIEIPRDANDAERFDVLDKGDLILDDGLVCLRGAKAMRWNGKQFVDLPLRSRTVRGAEYELPALPCPLLIVTAEKKQFDTTVFSANINDGAYLEYRERQRAENSTAKP